MSNYFDNQSQWSWRISEEGVFVTTDHGNHTHTLEVTNISIGEMANQTGEVMGKAHRAAPHDYKDLKIITDRNDKGDLKMGDKQSFLDRIRVDDITKEKLNEVSKDYSQMQSTAKKTDDGGRERGDDGPGKQGRESGLKSGSKVEAMRMDMKAESNTPKGQLSQNGKALPDSGQTSASISGGKAVSGNGVSVGGKGSSGGEGSSGGGHGTSGGGHGGSAGGSGVSGGGHGVSGGGHGGH